MKLESMAQEGVLGALAEEIRETLPLDHLRGVASAHTLFVFTYAVAELKCGSGSGERKMPKHLHQCNC